MLAISAAVCYSVYILFGNRVSSSVSPVATSGYVSLFAAVSTGLIGVVAETLRFDFAPAGWLPVLGLAVVSTVVAIGAFFAGMSLTGPSTASILSMFEPVVSIVAAWLLLDSRMTVPQLLGGAVVLAGALLAVTAGRPRPTPVPVEPARESQPVP